jgi:TRAP-type C4-dicarboxylate transport system substrate-binding protein
MIDVAALPYNIPKAVTGGRAMMAYWRKGHMDHELREIQPICFMTGHGDTLFTQDKGVESLADIKGMKINASTPLVQEKVRLWGGVPVAVPFTDLYTALQKKTIDGIMLNWMVMELFKLNEVLNYATLPGQGTVCSGFIMNKKTYAKLPPEGKAFIKETADKYSDMFNQGWDKLCGAGRDRFLKTGGKELHWTDAALQKRAELEGPLWEKWIEDKEKRGLPGRKAVDDLYYILEGLGVKPTTVGYTPK